MTLKEYRKSQGYTQAAMSRAVGVSITAWQRWEQGSMNMSQDKQGILAKFWDIDQAELTNLLNCTKTD